MCLPSDALSQYLPSYLSFFYLERGVYLNGCSSKAQPLFLTLDEVAPLERGVALLGPPAPAQPLLLVCGIALLGRLPSPQACGSAKFQRIARRERKPSSAINAKK